MLQALAPDAIIAINWVQLAAVCAVFAATYGLIQRAIVGPMVQAKLNELGNIFNTTMEIERANRQAADTQLIKEIKEAYLARPADPKDYPFTRRESESLQEKNQLVLGEMVRKLEGYHQRLRDMEEHSWQDKWSRNNPDKPKA